MNVLKSILMVSRVVFGVLTFAVLIGLSYVAMFEKIAPFFPFFRWYVECGLESYYYLTNLIIGFIVTLFLIFVYQVFIRVLTLIFMWLRLKIS